MVRNGHAVPRQVLTSSGAVEVVAPRVNDKRVDEATGERRRFASVILPAWCRKSPKINEVLPLLYLHGLSSSGLRPGVAKASWAPDRGCRRPTITRLTAQWQDEAKAFDNRDLSTVDYVYVWADGVHLNIRLDEEKLCLLVMIGVRVDGTKELIALAEGYRESTGSWADLLRDCKRRGMRAPVLAVGDGALGFWAALREVFPETREQRCWFHKIGNVLSALPKSAHPGAKKALAEIWNAEDRDHARRAVAAFKLAYGAKFGKAVAKITDDLDELLAFYDFPARALGSSAHDQPHRVNLRHRPSPDEGHEGPGLEGRRPGHGVQAHRGRPAAVARGQRTSPRRARTRRRPLRQGPPRRTTHRRRRSRSQRRGGGLMTQPPIPIQTRHQRQPVGPSRDDTATRTCPVCQRSFTATGRQTYCGSPCRKTAFRRRHQQPLAAITVPAARPRREFTIYECPSCEDRLLGEQRCPTCGIFARRVDIGGPCPHCDQPVTLHRPARPRRDPRTHHKVTDGAAATAHRQPDHPPAAPSQRPRTNRSATNTIHRY